VRRLAQALLLLVAALGGPALIALSSREADASVAYASPYTFEQTFGTAMRLLRVDLGLKIKEKDSDNGYLLFDYTSPESGKRVYPGSIECVRTPKGVHVAVQLSSMPRYHEQMIVDQLVKKLSAEHGDPPVKAKPPPRAPEPDAGGSAEAGTSSVESR
jgi:hypothetical protein